MAASTSMAKKVVTKVAQKLDAVNAVAQMSTKSEDFDCPVCLDILIEPVTMLCAHSLCYSCFLQNLYQTSLRCPVCRKRISSWTREATRLNFLVNQKLWSVIQKAFPDKVSRKLEAANHRGDAEDEVEDATTSDNSSDQVSVNGPLPRPQMAMQGEIGREFEELLTKTKEEEDRLHELEKKESEELILKLQQEESLKEQERKDAIEKDFQLAKQLSRAINEQVPTRVVGPVLRPNKRRACASDARLVDIKEKSDEPMTSRRSVSCIDVSIAEEVDVKYYEQSSFQKHVKKESEPMESASSALLAVPGTSSCDNKVPIARSNSIESEDSITEELRHFRPIKGAPKTPPRLLPDGSTDIEPELIHATPKPPVPLPRNLLPQLDIEHTDSTSDDGTASKDPLTMENAAWLHKRLASMKSDRLNKVTTLSKSTETKKPIPCTVTAADQAVPPFAAPQGSRLLRCDTTKRKSETLADADDLQDDENSNNDIELPAKRILLSDPATPAADQDPPIITNDAVDSLPAITTNTRPQVDDSHFLDPMFVDRDRLIALQLHRQFQHELMKDPYRIDRRKGTPGQYSLRNKDTGIST